MTVQTRKYEGVEPEVEGYFGHQCMAHDCLSFWLQLVLLSTPSIALLGSRIEGTTFMMIYMVTCRGALRCKDTSCRQRWHAIMIIPSWPRVPIALTFRLRPAKQNEIRLDISGQMVDVEADEVSSAKHAAGDSTVTWTPYLGIVRKGAP
eukprot:3950531-Amphidinium_carterae.1